MTRAIYLVDDDPSLRGELAEVLEAYGLTVQGFASGEALLAALDELAPGCVLLDLNMPGRGGLEIQAELVKRNASHQVIILTGAGSIATAVTAVQAGASNFLEKPFSADLLLAAIEAAFGRLSEQEAGREMREKAQARFSKLSDRQREVLSLLVQGKPNKIVAHELGLSVRTVEVYRANLMNKIGVRSLAEAIKVFNVVNQK